jgi:hypothetical protein
MSVSVPKHALWSSRIGEASTGSEHSAGYRPPNESKISQAYVLNPFPTGISRKSLFIPEPKRPKSPPPAVDLEQFGRKCDQFLSQDDRARVEPRPGTFIYSWAVELTQGGVGAGLLLSYLVYFNQRSPRTGEHRLKPSFVNCLSDVDLNPESDQYLRRPFFLNYTRVFYSIGLSERQIIDAINVLVAARFIERHKVEGHRGPVIVLSRPFHQKLGSEGKLKCDYQPLPDEGEWRTWINASEVIALPRLTQTLVLARWLRWMQSPGLKKRPENTHAQIAQQTGLTERSVALAMKQLAMAGLLKPDYVKKRIPNCKLVRIPSPVHGAKESEQLRRLTVEQLAKHYRLPLGADLSVFWRDDEDHADGDQADDVEMLDHYQVASLVGPPVRPKMKFRRRRKISRHGFCPASSLVE